MALATRAALRLIISGIEILPLSALRLGDPSRMSSESRKAEAVNRSINFPLVVILFLSALAGDSQSCQVPVFRYALENWQPDPFEVVILYRETLTEDQRQLVESLRQASSPDEQERANINVILLDAADVAKAEEYEKQLIQQYGDQALPMVLVYFPLGPAGLELVWSGDLTSDNAAAVVQSPARTEIAKRLLDGQSAVWVLIESGDAQKDDQAEETLRKELAGQKDKIHLPSLQELATEEKFNQEVEVDLRVEFSIVRISRDDPQEAVFRGMLLASESDLKEFDEPIAIPIFGRGRSYFALIGAGINADTIEENCMFMCGPCSCEAKRMNPGRDMLVAANWNQIIPRDWSFDTPLPELTGVGAFEAALDDDADVNTTDTEADQDATDDSVVALAGRSKPTSNIDSNDTSIGAEAPSSSGIVEGGTGSLESSLVSVFLGVAGVGLCLVIGVTLWLRSGKHH